MEWRHTIYLTLTLCPAEVLLSMSPTQESPPAHSNQSRIRYGYWMIWLLRYEPEQSEQPEPKLQSRACSAQPKATCSNPTYLQCLRSILLNTPPPSGSNYNICLTAHLKECSRTHSLHQTFGAKNSKPGGPYLRKLRYEPVKI